MQVFMQYFQTVRTIALYALSGLAMCAGGLPVSQAHAEPNGNYSSFSLSYRSTTLSAPVCIGNECHTQIAGPSVVYSYQFIPNMALGINATSLQSTGNTSTLKYTANSIFLESIVGLGPTTDVGIVLAPVNNSWQKCSTTTSVCSMTSDSGSDVGVFGVVFLNKHKSSSVELSYDILSYQTSGKYSVIGVSLVTVLAGHHRLALNANQVQDIGANITSNNVSYGYSYLF